MNLCINNNFMNSKLFNTFSDTSENQTDYKSINIYYKSQSKPYKLQNKNIFKNILYEKLI